MLNRPEYTWLSTHVFDPHSPFHGMTVSTGLRELRKALQDLRRQEFMSADVEDYSDSSEGEQQRFQHFVRRVLVWDQEPLRQAIALNDQYEEFVRSKTYEHAEYLDNSVKQAARTRLKTRMSKLFRQARKYQALAPATEGSALRSSLITEIKNLQEAQPTLTRVLQVSTALGIDAELRSALSNSDQLPAAWHSPRVCNAAVLRNEAPRFFVVGWQPTGFLRRLRSRQPRGSQRDILLFSERTSRFSLAIWLSR